MKSRAIGPMSALLVAASASAAKAGEVDLPYREAVAAQSRLEALGARQVELLERLPGPGREVVLAQLLDLFPRPGSVAEGEPGVEKVLADADSLRAQGSGWYLEVRGGGEWMRYWNWGYLHGSGNPLMPVESRLSPTVLEEMAQECLKHELGPFVRLGPGEELRAWTASYLVRGFKGQSGPEELFVEASRITLVRVVRGVPVVGSGSRVSMIFANDGTLVGFDLDWPELRASGRKVMTDKIATVRSRAESELREQVGVAGPEERRPLCGYYDPGGELAKAPALLGPACIRLVGPLPGGGVLWSQVISIGREPVPE